MTKQYYAPGVYAEEVDENDTVVRPASTSVGLMFGVTRKGPVNKVMGPFYDLPQWEQVYGGAEQTYKQWYNVRGFFKNGGVKLYYNRLAHYTNITSPATRTGTVASRTIQTAEGVATAGYVDGTSKVAPYILANGDTLVVDVDNGGAATATFNGAAATLTSGNSETYNLSGSETLTAKINRGNVQTVTFQAGDFAVAGAATAEEVAAAMNNGLTGCSVAGTTTVVITSDQIGTGSYIEVTGGTANTALGFSTSETQGTGDAANLGAVTYAEAKAVIENDITGCTVSQLGAGYMRISSDTTGASSEIDVQSGAAMAKLGFSATVGAGLATNKQNTLKLEFGYRGYDSPGTEPNGKLKTKVYKDPRHVTAGAGSDLAADSGASATNIQLNNLKGLEIGSIIKIWDGTNSEYRQLTNVASTIESGSLKHRVYWTTALTNSYTAALAQVESREFTVDVYWDDVVVEQNIQMTMLDTDSDYIETRMNDNATGSKYLYATDLDATNGLGADIPDDDTAATAMTTAGTSEVVGLTNTDYMGDQTAQLGVYAADSHVLLVDQVAYPGYHDATALNHLSQWCKSNLLIYPTFAVPLTYDAAAAATWRSNTLGLYSKYGSVEYPGYKVYDPLSGAAKPLITVTAEGHIMGLRSRVDAIPGANDGGVWSTAAGEGQFGQLTDILDLEREVTESEQKTLNPLGVNCTRRLGGNILRYGGRTLSNNQKWIYENVVRMFMFAEKSMVQGTRWAVFRNNNFRLWDKLKDAGDDFFEWMQANRAFPGASKAENWFIRVGTSDGTMDQADIDAGNIIGEIGLAPNKPGEFMVWRFSQFKAGGFAIEEI
jgi:phage tail sheath protein FI